MSGEKSPGAGNSNSLHRVNISQTPEVVKQNALEDKVILLQDELTLYPKGKTAQVTLTNSYIKIAAKSKKPYYIFLNEVVGCQLVEGNQTTSAKHYFCIFYYPIKKKVFGQNSRHRCSRSLGVQTHSSSEENLAEALIWRLAIKMIVDGKHLLSSHIDQLRSGELSEKDLQKRRYLVCVNPFSGSGKAKQMYKKNVRKLLSEAEITHELFKTERRGHAHDRMRSENLNNFDAIVIVSGDGLVHEIINGIMKRDDWREAIRTPIGIVPGGSGNALAAAIAYASFGRHPMGSIVYSSIFNVVRGRARPLDLMRVSSPSPLDGAGDRERTVRYAMLGLVHGIISDVDIEGERLRFLGGRARNLLFGVLRTVNLRRYNMEVSYLPLEGGVGGEEEWVRLARCGSISVCALTLSHVGEGELISRDVGLCDGAIRLSVISDEVGPGELMDIWDQLATPQGLVASRDGSKKVMTIDCRGVRLRPLGGVGEHFSRIMTVDGEVVEYGDTECRICDHTAFVLSTDDAPSGCNSSTRF